MERTECAEDDEGESVAHDPFANGAEHHQETAEAKIHALSGDCQSWKRWECTMPGVYLWKQHRCHQHLSNPSGRKKAV